MANVKFFKLTKELFESKKAADGLVAGGLYFVAGELFRADSKNTVVRYSYPVKFVTEFPESAASAEIGVIYVNTTTNFAKASNGTKWMTIGPAVVQDIAANAESTEAVPSVKAIKDYVDNSISNIDMSRVEALEGKVDVEKVSTAIEAGVKELDDQLKAIAKSGAAADVSIADAGNLFEAANVEAALQEVAAKINSVETAGAVTIEKTVGAEGDAYASKYTFKQGGVAITNGEITIGKDLVATNGELVTEDGEGNKGTFIKMTIANGTPFYINVASLVEYNDVESTAEITLTNADHVIKATVGEIAASKITYGESTVDAALTILETTVAKLDGNEDTEGSVAKALKDAKAYADAELQKLEATTAADATAEDSSAIAGVQVVTTVTQTDGLVSMTTAKADKFGSANKALTDAKAYTDAEIDKIEEAISGINTGISDLDAEVSASGTVDKGGVLVINGITQTDGKITAVESIEVEQAGAADAVKTALEGAAGDAATAVTIAGAKKHADEVAATAESNANSYTDTALTWITE